MMEEVAESHLPGIAVHSSVVGSVDARSVSPPFAGLSYSLSRTQETFKLPPTSTLQPGETACGQLDSWPVRPLKPTSSTLPISHSANPKLAHLAERQARQNQLASARGLSVIPKPKVLERLESHLEKELRLLGCPSVGPHELRLQAHREVFDRLIEDFRTYKPLFSAIKNEYELFIAHQQEVLRELEPLKAKLETVKEECERKIMSLKEEEKNGEAGKDKENRRLHVVIEKMKAEELSLKAQVEALQKEVAQLYENYRSEADARKLLVSDYNDLKYRQAEQKAEECLTEEREDPVVLKLKFTRAREDLRTANLRINTMLADYGDVVPRRDFEVLEASCKSLEAELEAQRTDHFTLIQEHDTLQATYKELSSERDQLADELTQLKRSATPRPEWSRCGRYLKGGAERWAEASAGCSSEKMVDVLLAEIAGVDVSEIQQGASFQAKGLGAEVPRHLRAEGTIRNKRYGKKEACKLISGFWKHRLAATDTTQPLDECLFDYLMSVSGSEEALAVEEGYNLLDACSRLDHEPHVSLFREVLCEELDESVFHSWLTAQTHLFEALGQQAEEESVVSEAVLAEVLRAQCPAKPPEHVNALVASAVQHASVQDGKINFLTLSTQAAEDQPGPFALLLLEQSRRESREFVAEIANSLTGRSDVTLAEVQAVIESLDPSTPQVQMASALSRAFGIPAGQVGAAGDASSPLTALLSRLQSMCVHRSGPRPM